MVKPLQTKGSHKIFRQHVHCQKLFFWNHFVREPYLNLPSYWRFWFIVQVRASWLDRVYKIQASPPPSGDHYHVTDVSYNIICWTSMGSNLSMGQRNPDHTKLKLDVVRQLLKPDNDSTIVLWPVWFQIFLRFCEKIWTEIRLDLVPCVLYRVFTRDLCHEQCKHVSWITYFINQL